MVRGGMQSFVVVVVDVGEHLLAGFRPGREDAGTDLGLEAGEERLGDSVVETRPGPAHRRPHVQPGQGGPELLRCVLAAAVGVEDRTGVFSTAATETELTIEPFDEVLISGARAA